MPNKNDIVFQQRDTDNTKFVERVISGSNLYIKTDQDGVLTSSAELSASYSLTASYVDSVESASYAITSSHLPHDDGLNGSYVRTLYSRNNTITFVHSGALEAVDVDFFSSSLDHSYGSRFFSTEFFTNSTNYKAKIIHFRTVNYLTDDHPTGNNTNFSCSLYIGDQKLTNSDVGSVELASSNSKPSEISGEIIMTQGNAKVCYSIGWCDTQGNYNRVPLSNIIPSQNVSGFLGGDLKLIINKSTDRTIDSYMGYIQVY